ncbi:hypothetical protein ACTXT7_008464 [Hymenolepis weldensis]
MTPNSYLPYLNAPNDFPSLFYNHLVSHKKHICAYVLTRPHPSNSYKAIFDFHTITAHACQLPAPTLTAHLLSSSTRSSLSPSPTLSLSLSHSLQSSLWLPLAHFWSNQLLVFCSTIVVSSYSNSYELATVIAVSRFSNILATLDY